MAHILIEYSSNIEERIDFPEFLEAVHAAALTTGIFPIGGMRTRAYPAAHYRVADGHADNAFVHVMVRVGHSRDLDTRKRAGDCIFAALCKELQPLFEQIPLGLSLEMQEIDPALSFKKNNLHEYVKVREGGGK